MYPDTEQTEIPPPPVLFRFGKREHLHSLVRDGVVSMGLASGLRNPALTEAQRDDETIREFSSYPVKHDLITDSGEEIKRPETITGLRILFKMSGRDGNEIKYYLWCSSLQYSPDLYADFEADTCVRINDPAAFGNRLLTEARKRFPAVNGDHTCDLYGRDVRYYSIGTFPPSSEQEDLIFLKEDRFARQKEFRIIFAVNPRIELPQRIEFTLGRLSDIAEIFPA